MTAGAIPIYAGQDFYVPSFEVRLRGRPLGQDVVRDIVQVTYKDNIEQLDSFEITINNWDARQRDFKYSDQDLFDPGKEVELWLGYYGKDHLRLMIIGDITSLRPTFPAAGQPMLVISGLNLLHRFKVEQEPATYENLTDSQIARQIGQRLGVTVRTDAQAETRETPYTHLIQASKYDIIFLMERARRIGYDLFVEETGQDGQAGESRLYFGPSVNVRRTTYRLTYGRSLMEFQPNLDTSNQVSEVIVRGWDPIRKARIEATARRSQIQTRGVGTQGGQAELEQSFSDRREIITDRPVESQAEAETLARETLERIAKDMLKGSGSTVGLPDLRAGSVIEIDGLEQRSSNRQRFSGRYFVTATTHTISDSGYTTQFECRREQL